MDYPIIDAVATGARIRELRIQHHLKVSDISHYMGFESDQAIYKWQRGDALPTVDNLYALSILFGTSMNDIIIDVRQGEAEASPSVVMGVLVTTFIVD
ncbi:MAG: helix-turn-helix domain-containing protein [Lachnospiraceae bacterium]|nr:helix-turn-helix domain-containing protein [Lachnospiraceae bacterium]